MKKNLKSKKNSKRIRRSTSFKTRRSKRILRKKKCGMQKKRNKKLIGGSFSYKKCGKKKLEANYYCDFDYTQKPKPICNISYGMLDHRINNKYFDPTKLLCIEKNRDKLQYETMLINCGDKIKCCDNPDNPNYKTYCSSIGKTQKSMFDLKKQFNVNKFY